MTYAPCTYCRTEKPAPSGNCYNCGAPLLEVFGTWCGRPIADRKQWLEMMKIEADKGRFLALIWPPSPGVRLV